MTITQNTEMVDRARKALAAQKVLKGTKAATSSVLDDLRKHVENGQVAYNDAVRTLFSKRDNIDESPIGVYSALKGTFGHRLPNYTDWYRLD
jgi:hypothetical protein